MEGASKVISKKRSKDSAAGRVSSTDEELIRELKKEKIIRHRKHVKIATGILILILCIYMAVGVVGLHYLQKLTADMPELNVSDLTSEDSSKIYDANGDLITEVGTYYRSNIHYDDCPESLVDAFLSIEDSRFFTHNGFDIPRFTASIISTLRGNTQGGSTFTMQLIKNSYFSIDDGDNSVERSATIEYKVQQIVLSMKLETELSKKEIFELYMNKLNFGDRIRGVEKAAEYYFGKSASDMNLSESALLAGIVNQPNNYNPYHYLDWSTERRNEVLQMMLQHGYISESEYKLAKSIKVEDQLVGADKLTEDSSQYSEYVDVAIDEALQMTGKDPVLYGMDIYTSMEPTIQQKIEDIEAGNTSVQYFSDTLQTAMISINNQTGEIVGIGGGRNYQGGARLLNRATSQYKQPGSSVKPVLSYALAFEYLGYSLDEVLVDKPITLPGESRVLVNADGKYRGDVTIKDAVANSLNIPAILTLQKITAAIGEDGVIKYLNSIGFSHASADNFDLTYAIGGNTFETTVEELAGAHATMMNQGVYNEPHTIRRIEMDDGDVYYPDNQNKQVLSAGSCWLTDQLMYNNVTTTTVYNYMQVLQKSYPTYAKTGTTDWGTDGLQYGIPEGARKDKWMVCSTSQYTNAVWVGWDKAEVGGSNYFNQYQSNLNIPGNTNLELLNAEEQIPNANLSGVERSSDVQDISYVYGTYPHVEDSDASAASKVITSQVSSAGLSNVPLISASQYASGSPELTNVTASVSNSILYINWNAQDSCSGGTRDISLHDSWNNISKTGTCLADTSWLFGTNTTYIAEIYQNDTYVRTITDKDNSYSGYASDLTSGVIKVCGYYKNSHGTSNQICTIAGDFTDTSSTSTDSSDSTDESTSTDG
jgi:penicillin-binding protein 1A